MLVAMRPMNRVRVGRTRPLSMELLTVDTGCSSVVLSSGYVVFCLGQTAPFALALAPTGVRATLVPTVTLVPLSTDAPLRGGAVNRSPGDLENEAS